ncbi:hypothetical protein [Nostoc sp.]|uniref:hypothetical protein n=1 Tax=Nostoc sp. TaxID=1180 RepID=UPI002FF88992
MERKLQAEWCRSIISRNLAKLSKVTKILSKPKYQMLSVQLLYYCTGSYYFLGWNYRCINHETRSAIDFLGYLTSAKSEKL